LQCVAVCCSVLQCVAVCCSVLQCVVVHCRMLQYVAVCCSATLTQNILQVSSRKLAMNYRALLRKDAEDALSRRSFHVNEPLIIRLYSSFLCRKKFCKDLAKDALSRRSPRVN